MKADWRIAVKAYSRPKNLTSPRTMQQPTGGESPGVVSGLATMTRSAIQRHG